MSLPNRDNHDRFKSLPLRKRLSLRPKSYPAATFSSEFEYTVHWGGTRRRTQPLALNPSSPTNRRLDSLLQSEEVGGYKLSPRFATILRAIISKYGDIAKECTISSIMRDIVLEGVCKVVVELQSKQLTDLEEHHLHSYLTFVKDAEGMKMDVKWLKLRLHKLLEAVKSMVEVNRMMKEQAEGIVRMDQLKSSIQNDKEQIKKLRLENKAKQSQLETELRHSEKLNVTIGRFTEKYQSFITKSVTEGLI